MGLDMYLYKRKIGAKLDKEGLYKPEEFIEVGYWRKANAIHEWFNQNCADGYLKNCEEYEVTKADLSRLISDCETVLANHNLAQEILPPSSGFFYGSTEINEWYFRELQQTIDIASDALNTDFDEWTLIYYAWW
jgi:hypothetical protein